MKEQKFAIFAKNVLTVKTFCFYMNNLKIIILEFLIETAILGLFLLYFTLTN